MPELPEVESLRRSLEPGLLGRVVERVELRRRDIVDGPATPAALLQGERIDNLRRHGKQMAIVTSSGKHLVVQLGMTGQVLLVHDEGELPPDHVHAVWRLRKDGSHPGLLAFRDPRRFGGLTTLESREALQRRWSSLGPDALGITGGELLAGLRASKRAIKAALLDQAVLAGVGNIYADESLFLAQIAPRKLASRLNPKQVDRLAEAIRGVLEQAVRKGGSTLRDYVDASGRAGSFALEHQVYGRAGRPCVRCQTPLRSATLAQRTTVWCPLCQGSNPLDYSHGG